MPATRSAVAQSAPQTIVLGHSTIPLNGTWKFSPGDSPWIGSPAAGHFLWAQPAFDDARWASMDLTPPANSNDVQFSNLTFTPGWTSRGYPNLRRYAWYRLRLHIDSQGQAVWLEMPVDVDDAYQVFANGQYLGQFGEFHHGRVTPHYGHPVTLQLPSQGNDIELAVRFFMSDVSPLRWPEAGGMHAPPVLGLAAPIFLQSNFDEAGVLNPTIGDWESSLLCLLALPLVLWAAVRNPGDRAWRWLALALACNMAGGAAQTLGNLVRSLSMWSGEFWGLSVFILGQEFCWILFWYHWFGLENRRWIPRAAALLTAVYFLVNLCFESPLLGFTFASQSLLRFCSAAIVYFCAALGLLLLLVLIEAFRKDGTAALVATAPILLLEYSSFYIPLLVFFHLAPRLYIGSFGLDYYALTAISTILIVGALSIRRFLRNRDIEIIERESVARDLEQARQLQQSVLVPENIASPRYSVAVAYRPAQTVGGDFFLDLAQPDGTLLLVIGDVSGKGISAAMLVAVLVGAARARARDTSDPAAILAELNAQLIGRSGDHFATCLVAALSPDGTLHIANAGHLPPYRNGAEIPLEGSLPLGMTAVLDPAHCTLQLRPGDALTFLTDGVVEARSATGALFGFERTRGLSALPAEQIAATAQAHGQQDDITVLTLQYAPAEVLHV
ncbi:MAG TPA: SpoIIE family protein phosphatase [Acidobacteriaceae bacterium]|jgi:hypothetical protein|nr:SpoIIE family protein phosphatase [Acidobacteriaceae bacterium]